MDFCLVNSKFSMNSSDSSTFKDISGILYCLFSVYLFCGELMWCFMLAHLSIVKIQIVVCYNCECLLMFIINVITTSMVNFVVLILIFRRLRLIQNNQLWSIFMLKNCNINMQWKCVIQTTIFVTIVKE